MQAHLISMAYFIWDWKLFSGFTISESFKSRNEFRIINATAIMHHHTTEEIWKAEIFDKMMMSIATFGVHLLQICDASA